ncbi:1,2-phenylacetyl-CoA epoxidase subunit PaaA [Rhodococcus sp. BH5]|uniref:1,2-phenylacetyl-CoA epoxidase subunit PaaA n=1 Tax=Rhodococcus sp. BH5 TaxID=2871702 RepID=UPI0022CDB664|nr:1,2-phenylacetyl-CoA epoxidase subunit PaaA [Rhodococcus sp. BH5]MCZ9634921.1 1,2-phenylacetyl-CoA epoxidase subunit A [Rhodococcus sp. BH5]
MTQSQEDEDCLIPVFEHLLKSKESIEPEDWMPEGYRRMLIRQIAQHAHSEIIGMQPEGAWLTRAPSLHRKAVLLAKVQDEAGHGLYLYSAVETLGVDRNDLLESLRNGHQRYSTTFNHPALTWADTGVISWMVDGAAVINQVPLCRTSYGPYARAMRRVCQEEAFHVRQGYDMLWTMCQGTPEQKAMVQDAVDRWWLPALALMLGPPDTIDESGTDRVSAIGSSITKRSIAWRIKLNSNDELRQKFVDNIVPQAQRLGLTIPDANLRWNEQHSRFDFSPIGWKQFRELMSENSDCAKRRLNRIVDSHENGKWVRDAVDAYVVKSSLLNNERK